MAHGTCPEINEGCPYFDEGCYSDNHHTYWPRPDYRTPLENTFRNLPENKEQVCRAVHDEIHEGPPPIKPSVEVMRFAVQEADVFISVSKRKKIGL